MMRRLLSLVALAVVTAIAAAPADAQLRIEDLVLTTGFSADGYNGNLASIAVPVVDSTDSANSLHGEVGINGRINLFQRNGTVARAFFDVGVRQYIARGFELRDYSPRERAALARVQLFHRLDRIGTLGFEVGGRIRSVADRPPVPLWLQAGFDETSAVLSYFSDPIQGVVIDARFDGARSNYEVPGSIAQLDLLDRSWRGFELGAAWSEAERERWRFRFYSGVRRSNYPQQASFDESDPFRRDWTINVGGTWQLQSSVNLEVGLVGVLNRSNSRRPEYDAISLTANLSTPLPFFDLGLNVFGQLTGKSYLEETEFARLVPGEEADNASILFVDVFRSLADNLDTTLRFGYTRAETDIGNSFYERFGLTVLFNYRPLIR